MLGQWSRSLNEGVGAHHDHAHGRRRTAAERRWRSTTRLIAVYFVFVLGIGYLARSQVSTSLDFFLSGRRLPAWVTGLAFMSANLGAVEIMGMSANGAQIGLSTMHYYWIGAVPAMIFLGVVMMPFYYGSKVRSVPEFMRRRFGTGRPPGQRDQLRGRPGADRRRQPVPAGDGDQRAARLADLGVAARRRRRSCSPTSPSAGCRPRSTTRCCSSSSSWPRSFR